MKTPTALVILLLALSFVLAAQDAVRVPESKAMAFVVSRTQPEYPAMAKQMKVSGKVEIDVYLDEAGKLEKVETVTGNMLLVSSAQRAVKQWKFKPVDMGSGPSKAVLRVGFSFTN